MRAAPAHAGASAAQTSRAIDPEDPDGHLGVIRPLNPDIEEGVSAEGVHRQYVLRVNQGENSLLTQMVALPADHLACHGIGLLAPQKKLSARDDLSLEVGRMA